MQGPTDPLLGTLVAGRYRVQRLLGEGGMGQVYLAEHEAIEKKVAIKILRHEFSSKADIVARFQREAVSASRIKHPNVLDVFDFGQLDDGRSFLAMEFLEGNDLADELTRHQVVDPYRGVRIALQICRALGAAHARGVVHRDLKPENVFLQRLVDGDEIVKIVDFGIAQLRTNEQVAESEPKRRRLTRTGMIFGTPEYMAPEQAVGKHADLRADIYALGIIMYEMFTSAVPFTGDTFMGVLTAHLNQPMPPMRDVNVELAISSELQAVIEKALAKDPDQRFQSMNELGRALVATPEGKSFARLGSIPDANIANFIPATAAPGPSVAPGPSAAPTAVQFPAHAEARVYELSTPRKSEAAARAETQLDAETHPPRVPVKSHGSWLFVGLLVAGAAAASVYVWRYRRVEAPRSELATEAPTQHSSAAIVPPTASSPATASAEPSSSVAPIASVHLDVKTEPPGAVLLKDGFQVCDSTPCQVSVAPGDTLELEAKKGVLHGTAKVLAESDQQVRIRLAAATRTTPAPPPKPAPPPPKPTTAPMEKLCTHYNPKTGIQEVVPCK
jgi:eukaryotic-like serine/threonine-protein kinase